MLLKKYEGIQNLFYLTKDKEALAYYMVASAAIKNHHSLPQMSAPFQEIFQKQTEGV